MAKLEGGLFRFVDPLRLLEIEAGIASNEAPQMAVREAIELASYGLILEGINDQIWTFKDPEAGNPTLAEYLDEKQESVYAAVEENG
ncbi:MAG: hypothetical protein NPIRA05_12300 [Nitrospirales bacterium]|nr:MAG: hypothetical protein NPIRA05_12300 [Nitrospirales bacterium]